MRAAIYECLRNVKDICLIYIYIYKLFALLANFDGIFRNGATFNDGYSSFHYC